MIFRKPSAQASVGTGDRSVWGNFWFNNAPGGRVTSPGRAMGLTAVFSCVKVLAESFAVMPYKLYQPQANGARGPQVMTHWSVRLFTRRPNRFQSAFEWRVMLMGHLALRGNAYCQISDDGRGNITELLPLHPDRMKVETLSNGEYRYAYTDQNGNVIRYTRGEIWHLRTLSDDGVMGISPLQQARDAIAEGLELQEYSLRFFANDAKPGGGWIEAPGSFASQADKQTFRDSWQQMQGGANRNKVAVLEKGMKFHELGLKNSDAQFVEARAAKVTDICRIFRVPPHMIGDLSRATFSNIEQQSMEFWTNTMLPWAEMWESSIEAQLLPEESTLEPEFDMKRMMRGDSAARSTYYQNGIQSGWLTRNEARQMEGLDPLPDLDEPLVPLNMVAADEAEEDLDADGDEKPGQDKREDAAEARLNAIIGANASRMAKRLQAGTVPVGLLAEALAITEAHAAAFLAQRDDSLKDDQLTAALVALATGEAS